MYNILNCWTAQWFRCLAAKPEVGSSIPHCASLTGVGLNDPEGPFQLCSSKIIKLYKYLKVQRAHIFKKLLQTANLFPCLHGFWTSVCKEICVPRQALGCWFVLHHTSLKLLSDTSLSIYVSICFSRSTEPMGISSIHFPLISLGPL